MIRLLFSRCYHFNFTVKLSQIAFASAGLDYRVDDKRCDQDAQPKPENSLPRGASRDGLLKAMALTLNVCNRLLLQAAPDQVQ
jgi:hypothetical protein